MGHAEPGIAGDKLNAKLGAASSERLITSKLGCVTGRKLQPDRAAESTDNSFLIFL
jgi:hypothetical protein